MTYLDIASVAGDTCEGTFEIVVEDEYQKLVVWIFAGEDV